ncbi:MAG: fused MFS/spermidine synthase [bacterium]|nr:fused MFS/spermidine synthase [bacterium]
MKPKKYILELAVFACGAIVMIFELVGSRVLGPYLGTSIFIWTSLIGIILASLSLGYYLGGYLADKKATFDILSLIVLAAAFFIGLDIVIKDPLLVFLQTSVSDIRAGSVIASLILFLPPGLLLGMVSPYAVKLKISDLGTSGSTVGKLYAISTAGSILGTFLSGFYLIPRFGTNKLLLILAAALIIVSLILSAGRFIKTKIIFLLLAGLGWQLADRLTPWPKTPALLMLTRLTTASGFMIIPNRAPAGRPA